MQKPIIKLHSTVGGSDKVYELHIRHAMGVPDHVALYDVIYYNGKRTSGPTSGGQKKNTAPLSLKEAFALHDKYMMEKFKSGYHTFGQCSMCEGGNTLPYTKPQETYPVSKPNLKATNVRTCAGCARSLPPWPHEDELCGKCRNLFQRMTKTEPATEIPTGRVRRFRLDED